MLFFVYFTEWGWWRGRDNKEAVIRVLFVTSNSQWRMCRQFVKCMETCCAKSLSLLPTVSQGIFYLSREIICRLVILRKKTEFIVNFTGMILVRKYNNWKTAENIYTLFPLVHFWPVLTVSSNFQQFLFRGK
jgi:hypothetical protein